MEHFTRILSLSLAMFAGCYIAGTLPLSVNLSESKLHMVTVLGSGLLVGTALAVIIPEGVHALYDNAVHEHDQHDHGEKTVLPSTSQTTQAAGFFSNLGTISEVEPHAFIGFSLCLGFVLMLFIDYCFGGHSHTPDIENNTRKHSSNFTATIGLVVHAAADGIAMGAAVVSSKPDVELMIFVAIMLHKAPAAFGLTTFLLHEGLQRNRIRKHLLIFSMAAPVLALLTYIGLNQSGKVIFSSVNGTGIAMLFSAGTFLYVATVHVLPETLNLNHSASVDGNEVHEHSKRTDLILLVVGIICPLILTATHHHGH